MIPRIRELLERAFANTDRRIADDRPVSPGFLVAALMWGPVRDLAEELLATEQARTRVEALAAAADVAMAAQAKRTSFQRRFTAMARDVWTMQPRLENRRPRRVNAMIAHPRFRAAYDFLCLRAEAGEPLADRAAWWTEVQEGAPPASEPARAAPRRRRRRRASRRSRAA